MARTPSSRRHGGDEAAEELNLTPIMSILVILIPVLLFAFTFYEVKIQAVNAPRLGSGSAKKPDENEKKPLNLTVLITSKGFTIKQQAEHTTEEEPKIYKRTFQVPNKDGVMTEVEEYDYPALYSKLAAKKTQYPDEKTINIGAEMNIPWHIIARTIDATRVRLEKDEYTDLAEYMKAQPKTEVKDGSKEPVALFPAVVFVVAE